MVMLGASSWLVVGVIDNASDEVSLSWPPWDDDDLDIRPSGDAVMLMDEKEPARAACSMLCSR